MAKPPVAVTKVPVAVHCQNPSAAGVAGSRPGARPPKNVGLFEFRHGDSPIDGLVHGKSSKPLRFFGVPPKKLGKPQFRHPKKRG